MHFNSKTKTDWNRNVKIKNSTVIPKEKLNTDKSNSNLKLKTVPLHSSMLLAGLCFLIFLLDTGESFGFQSRSNTNYKSKPNDFWTDSALLRFSNSRAGEKPPRTEEHTRHTEESHKPKDFYHWGQHQNQPNYQYQFHSLNSNSNSNQHKDQGEGQVSHSEGQGTKKDETSVPLTVKEMQELRKLIPLIRTLQTYGFPPLGRNSGTRRRSKATGTWAQMQRSQRPKYDFSMHRPQPPMTPRKPGTKLWANGPKNDDEQNDYKSSQEYLTRKLMQKSDDHRKATPHEQSRLKDSDEVDDFDADFIDPDSTIPTPAPTHRGKSNVQKPARLGSPAVSSVAARVPPPRGFIPGLHLPQAMGKQDFAAGTGEEDRVFVWKRKSDPDQAPLPPPPPSALLVHPGNSAPTSNSDSNSNLNLNPTPNSKPHPNPNPNPAQTSKTHGLHTASGPGSKPIQILVPLGRSSSFFRPSFPGLSSAFALSPLLNLNKNAQISAFSPRRFSNNRFFVPRKLHSPEPDYHDHGDDHLSGQQIPSNIFEETIGEMLGYPSHQTFQNTRKGLGFGVGYGFHGEMKPPKRRQQQHQNQRSPSSSKSKAGHLKSQGQETRKYRNKHDRGQVQGRWGGGHRDDPVESSVEEPSNRLRHKQKEEVNQNKGLSKSGESFEYEEDFVVDKRGRKKKLRKIIVGSSESVEIIHKSRNSNSRTSNSNSNSNSRSKPKSKPKSNSRTKSDRKSSSRSSSNSDSGSGSSSSSTEDENRKQSSRSRKTSLKSRHYNSGPGFLFQGDGVRGVSGHEQFLNEDSESKSTEGDVKFDLKPLEIAATMKRFDVKKISKPITVMDNTERHLIFEKDKLDVLMENGSKLHQSVVKGDVKNQTAGSGSKNETKVGRKIELKIQKGDFKNDVKVPKDGKTIDTKVAEKAKVEAAKIENITKPSKAKDPIETKVSSADMNSKPGLSTTTEKSRSDSTSTPPAAKTKDATVESKTGAKTPATLESSKTGGVISEKLPNEGTKNLDSNSPKLSSDDSKKSEGNDSAKTEVNDSKDLSADGSKTISVDNSNKPADESKKSPVEISKPSAEISKKLEEDSKKPADDSEKTAVNDFKRLTEDPTASPAEDSKTSTDDSKKSVDDSKKSVDDSKILPTADSKKLTEDDPKKPSADDPIKLTPDDSEKSRTTEASSTDGSNPRLSSEKPNTTANAED